MTYGQMAYKKNALGRGFSIQSFLRQTFLRQKILLQKKSNDKKSYGKNSYDEIYLGKNSYNKR